MITVKKIEPIVAEHFDPHGNSLGFLNEYENMSLRTQICKEDAFGYYLMFNGQRIELQTDGRLPNWPLGLYDHLEILSAELFTTQRLKNK